MADVLVALRPGSPDIDMKIMTEIAKKYRAHISDIRWVMPEEHAVEFQQDVDKTLGITPGRILTKEDISSL